MLNTSSIRRSGPQKQMYRTCASCRQRQAQPSRVLGQGQCPEPCRSAQRPRQGTAHSPFLGSVSGSARGTAASGPVPGFILGCGPQRPASRHPVRVISNGNLAGAVSGQHHSAGFPRPSVNVATFIIPLQGCRIVPFQPHASIPYGQGTVANVSGHSTLPKFGHVRCILIIVCNKRHGTQPVLHSSARLPLHHPSVLPLHNARVTRPQTACLGALGSLAQPPAIHPVCLAHCAAAVPTLTTLRPKPTAKAVGYEPTLRSFRSTVTPKSQPHLQPADQESPAYRSYQAISVYSIIESNSYNPLIIWRLLLTSILLPSTASRNALISP